MLRILMLMPLLATGVDLVRAQALCGANAQTCLEAAGRGWLGPLAVVLVLAYAVAGGLALMCWRPARMGLARTWGLSSLTLLAIEGAQRLVAQPIGGAAPLGTLALCLAAGALLALALRALDRVADLAPRAPRALPPIIRRLLGLEPPPEVVYVTVDGYRRGRAPPAR